MLFEWATLYDYMLRHTGTFIGREICEMQGEGEL
jgi:hypothetical protein